MDRYLRWLEVCARLGIPRLVIHVTSGYVQPESLDAGLASMGPLVAAAEQSGVLLAVENTRCPKALDLLFESFPSPALGLCFDSSHARLYDPDPPGMLAKWGGRLMVTHFSDNDGSGDCHWLPGEGDIDWPALAAAFPEEHRCGCLFLEVVPREEIAAHQAGEFLQRARRVGEWLAELIDLLRMRK